MHVVILMALSESISQYNKKAGFMSSFFIVLTQLFIFCVLIAIANNTGSYK